MHDIQTEFLNALTAQNIIPATTLQFALDGSIHRFSDHEKPKSDSCWYVAYNGDYPTIVFGNFRLGDGNYKFTLNGKKLTPEARAIVDKQIKEAKKKAAIERKKRADKAAIECQDIYNKADNATLDNPYLEDKKISNAEAIKGIKQGPKGKLIIPAFNNQGEIRTLQSIDDKGNKRFYPGGEKKGNFFIVGELSSTIYICEGVSTAQSIFEVTGNAVVVAFDVGNLLPVATAIQRHYPESTIIIAADNDHQKEVNAGLEAAKKAAKELGIGYCYPHFKKDEQGSDFNDLKVLHGEARVDEDLQKVESSSCSKSELTTDSELINRLAQLTPLEYDRVREAEANQSGVRISTLDKEVSIARKQISDDADSCDEYKTGVEPWGDVVNGEVLADDIRAIINRYCVLPEGSDIAATLFVIATYCINEFRLFPKLCVRSPEKRCGKSTMLEVLESLVNKAMLTSHITPSALFRSIECWQPTLIVDEADTFLKDNEDLRGIINSGHTKRHAHVMRTEGEGKEREPKQFSTWSPLILAMIGNPPDTILDRSIVVSLRRKLPDESVKRLPTDLFDKNKPIRQKIQRWVNDNKSKLAGADFSFMPPIENDRAGDNFAVIARIATLISKKWQQQLATAIEHIVISSDEENIGSQLLCDIRDVFESKGVDRIKTKDLLEALIALEDRPWGEWFRGKPMSAHGLAKVLSRYDIKPGPIRIYGTVVKGYKRDDFEDAINRYIPLSPISPEKTVTRLQMAKKPENARENVTDCVEVRKVTPEKEGLQSSGKSYVGYKNPSNDGNVTVLPENSGIGEGDTIIL